MEYSGTNSTWNVVWTRVRDRPEGMRNGYSRKGTVPQRLGSRETREKILKDR